MITRRNPDPFTMTVLAIGAAAAGWAAWHHYSVAAPAIAGGDTGGADSGGFPSTGSGGASTTAPVINGRREQVRAVFQQTIRRDPTDAEYDDFVRGRPTMSLSDIGIEIALRPGNTVVASRMPAPTGPVFLSAGDHWEPGSRPLANYVPNLWVAYLVHMGGGLPDQLWLQSMQDDHAEYMSGAADVDRLGILPSGDVHVVNVGGQRAFVGNSATGSGPAVETFLRGDTATGLTRGWEIGLAAAAREQNWTDPRTGYEQPSTAALDQLRGWFNAPWRPGTAHQGEVRPMGIFGAAVLKGYNLV